MDEKREGEEEQKCLWSEFLSFKILIPAGRVRMISVSNGRGQFILNNEGARRSI